MPIIEEFERDLAHHFSDSSFKMRQVETDENTVEIKEYAEASKIMLGEE